jgi:hypothetical protein
MKKNIELKPKDWIIHSISPSSRHLRELGEAFRAHFHAFMSIFFHKICRRVFACNAFMMQSIIYIVLALKVFTSEKLIWSRVNNPHKARSLGECDDLSFELEFTCIPSFSCMDDPNSMIQIFTQHKKMIHCFVLCENYVELFI